VEEATQRLRGEDWSRYSTYLQSRPEEAELSAIRLLLSLCREYRFLLHIVHLSASQAIPELRAARAKAFTSPSRLPPLSAFLRRGDP